MASKMQKIWRISQALGDIAFSYPYSIVLLEIQDTLKSSPPENQTMKKASKISVFVTTFFYLCCGCFGYAAFGNDTPGNLMTGFGFYEPYWLIDLANVCIVLHLIGDYQVFSQQIFAFVDRWCAGIAMLFPYFNLVLGILGAVNFWPLAIYFPVEMYLVQTKIGAYSRKRFVLRAFSLCCLLVSVVALVGSVEGVISERLK